MAEILLVEDNQNNADYIIRILTGGGHSVQHFIKGLDGARATRDWRPDLILLDFNLPDIDGSVLILALKKTLGTENPPPIVAVTARASSVDRRLAEKLGFTGFLGKPFEPDELLQLVDTVLAGAAEDTANGAAQE